MSLPCPAVAQPRPASPSQSLATPCLATSAVDSCTRYGTIPHVVVATREMVYAKHLRSAIQAGAGRGDSADPMVPVSSAASALRPTATTGSTPADPTTLTSDHITALCSVCHEIATTLRQFHRNGDSIWQFMDHLREAVSSMRYQVTLRGLGGLIQHNGAAGLDTRSPANLEKTEITRKRGSNRTEDDDVRLRGARVPTQSVPRRGQRPDPPAAAIRSMIERAARKLKQGPQVLEGLVVEAVNDFNYDRDRLGTTVEELGQTAQFTVGVVVQRARLLRTRAIFDPWSVTATLDCDDELVDQEQLETWLDIGGRRIGLGDWRPEKSGSYGRFTAEVKPLG